MSDKAVAEAVTGAINECPVQPVGYKDGNYFYISPSGELRQLKDREHSEAGLTSLFDGDLSWLMEQFPRENKYGGIIGIDVRSARAYLMRGCAQAGIWDSIEQRGTGVWRGSDDKLVLNLGNRVLHGEAKSRAGYTDGDVLYVAGGRITPPAPETADVGLAQNLLTFLNSWNWRHKLIAPRLFLGWLGCAYVCGALDWRPHIWITGGLGSGKSSIEAVMGGLLGDLAKRILAPSEAGIRQTLQHSALPLVIDEIERAGQDGAAEKVAALARLASTRNEKASILRGSADGVAQHYRVNSCFCFTSIHPARMPPQDASRVTLLHLDRLEDLEKRMGQSEHEDMIKEFAGYSAEMFARLINGFDRFRQNLLRFKLALAALGHSSRDCDQFGTLLAASETLLSDDVVEFEGLSVWLQELDLEAVMDTADRGSDANEVIDTLMTAQLDQMRNGYKLTVSEALQAVACATTGVDTDDIDKMLRRNGLALRRDDDKWWLWVSNSHRALERMFADTPYSGRNWRHSLQRVDKNHQIARISFAGHAQRAVGLPLSAFGLTRKNGEPIV